MATILSSKKKTYFKKTFMKKIITILLVVGLNYSCSTSSDGNGNSTTSVVPVAPSNLTGSVVSTTQIDLSWTDNSTNETGFKIERKTGTGSYSVIGTTAADITIFNDIGLIPSTTYTYRVYSNNSVGNSLTYSNELTLTTASIINLPTLTSTSLSLITSSTALSGGTVSSDGGAVITTRGVCWSTSPSPNITLPTKTSDGTGIGTFSSNLTGLSANTTYYVRAYATNSAGTAYGNEIVFTTQPPAAILPSVTICNQIWQNINLDVTTYRDGTPIPQVTDFNTWSNLTTGAWCYYNNDPANGAIYGKLYNWYAIMGIHDNDPSTPNKILAPQGWHVSTNDDWNTLTSCLGDYQIAGGPLKTTGTSYWNSPNLGATNSTGFSALPGGFRDVLNNGNFEYKNVFADFWCYYTTPVDRILSYNYKWISSLGPYKNEGLSVRCVKD
jgi:uncharacterized protein (TIGR02145 family)